MHIGLSHSRATLLITSILLDVDLDLKQTGATLSSHATKVDVFLPFVLV